MLREEGEMLEGWVHSGRLIVRQWIVYQIAERIKKEDCLASDVKGGGGAGIEREVVREQGEVD